MSTRLFLTAALGAWCAGALAWPPAERPAPPPFGYPPPWAETPWAQPPGLDRTPAGRFGVRPSAAGAGEGAVASGRPGGVRFTQERSEHGYLLVIDPGELPPANVQVRPAGQGLLVRVEGSASRERTETFGDGLGYRRSYGWSGGVSTRRLPVPADGDLGALQRSEDDGRIRILIPRRQPGAGVR